MSEDTPAPKRKTLSAGVDPETYDWFVAKAQENFRDISGQLAWLINRYKQEVEQDDAPLVEGFRRAGERVVGRLRQVPYVGVRDPGVQVHWGNAAPIATVPDRRPGDPGDPARQEPWPEPYVEGTAEGAVPIDDDLDPEEGMG